MTGLRGRDDETGSITLWLVGLSLLLLALGGISVDLWSAFAARRALAGVAEAAATAGASGIDVATYRDTGDVRLDLRRAERLAAATFAAQPDIAAVSGPPDIVVGPSRITVQVEGEVRLTLLRLFAPGHDSLHIVVRSVAAPQLSR